MIKTINMKFYNDILNFLSKRHECRDEHERSQLALLVFVVFLTGILMWCYAITPYLYSTNTLWHTIAFSMSIIHLSSLLLYYFFGSISLSLNVFLAAGFIHQFTWGVYTGGFEGYIALWFAVLPLIAGVVGGKKELLIWFSTSIIGAAFFYITYQMGIRFPVEISSDGYALGKIFIMVGLIILNSVFMLAYIIDRENFYKTIVQKREQIDALLTLVGHDISNPLTIVNLSTHKLKKILKDHEDERVSKALKRLEVNTEGMSNILKQIREIQAIKQGKVELSFEKIYLNEVVEHLSRFFEPNLTIKEISLEYDFELNKDIYFMGNLTALQYQIFGNLLSNAIKFSDHGRTIKIEARETKEGVQIHLVDEGIGMDEKLANLLFDSNYYSSRTGTEGEKGTGFGMAIVKSFVELCHGTIAVTSRTKEDNPDNHGTQFTLNFKKSLLS